MALTPLPSVTMFCGKTTIHNVIENEPQGHHVALVNVAKYTTRYIPGA